MIEEKNNGTPPKERVASKSPLGGGPSFHLFTWAGINVSVHSSWFIAAVLLIMWRKGTYHSYVFPAAEYVAVFGIVLLHEFGHAFACRQVGGKSDHITLWPLGGIAFVRPPPRPGAVLWSIAAGPLVNVALAPVTWGLYFTGKHLGWETSGPDMLNLLHETALNNMGLLIFNLLPVYPLDGGQILQALLWFVIGRAWSLIVACSIGMVSGAAMIGLALYEGFGPDAHLSSFNACWFILLGFLAMRMSRQGFQYGRSLARLGKYPRIKDRVCPACGEQALEGQRCVCACGAEFDPFAGGLVCPQCGASSDKIRCIFCGEESEIGRWQR